MKIAEVAPVYLRVPPKTRGGTEKIVSDLTEELVRQGHDVTLFATANSKTKAQLRAVIDKPLTAEKDFISWSRNRTLNSVLAHLAFAASAASEFDVMHFHFDDYAPQFASLISAPAVTTFHYLIDPENYLFLRRHYKNYYPIAISQSQKKNLRGFAGVVPNGLNLAEVPFQDKKEDFLVTAGRIVPDKGIKESIEIAKRLKKKLIIVGHVSKKVPRSLEYFEKNVSKEIDNLFVIHYPELSHKDLLKLFARAAAFIFPIQWAEPFGLVMIEALACGTPVIALNKGAVPEVVQHKKTGFICQNLDEMVAVFQEIPKIKPADCRAAVQKRFSIEKIAKEYLKIYAKAIEAHKK